MYSYVFMAVTCWLPVLCPWYWQLLKVESKGLKTIFSIVLIAGYFYRSHHRGRSIGLVPSFLEAWRGRMFGLMGFPGFPKKHPPQKKLGFANQIFCLLQGHEVSWPPEPESSFHLNNGRQQCWNFWASNAKINPHWVLGFCQICGGLKKVNELWGTAEKAKCLLLAPLLGSLARRFWFSAGALPPRMMLACSTMCSWGLGAASLLLLSTVGNLFLPRRKSISFPSTPRALTDPICAAALLQQLAQETEEHQRLEEEEGECSLSLAPLLFPLLW